MYICTCKRFTHVCTCIYTYIYIYVCVNNRTGEVGAERKDAGLMAKLFQEQWYNGDEIDPEEAGYVSV